MKKFIYIITTFTAILTSILVAGNKVLDFIDKLKAENKQTSEQLVNSHLIIRQYENDLGQVVEEKEECTTFQKILIEKKNSELEEHNQIINEYEKITDSLSGELITNEIKATDVPNIVINQSSIIKSSIAPKTLESVKSFNITSGIKTNPDKKKLVKRLFDKVKRNK